MVRKEKPSEWVIELAGWTLDYSFWVTQKRYQSRDGPFFDFLSVVLSGVVVIPSSDAYARANITMRHHDNYAEPIEIEDPHPIIGHVAYKKPVLEGGFSIPHRMIALICQAMDRGATKYLYLHSDPLKRNKAYVRSISFNSELDVEEYRDPS